MRKLTLFLLLLVLVAPLAAHAQVVPGTLTALNPCRLFDTRTDSASPLAGGTCTALPVRGRCNIPETAIAISAVLHGVTPGPNGYLLVWEYGVNRPVAATLASDSILGASSGTIVRLCYPALECGGLDIQVYNSGVTHFALDVTGYFEPLPED